jgi:hypothetical protein
MPLDAITTAKPARGSFRRARYIDDLDGSSS